MRGKYLVPMAAVFAVILGGSVALAHVASYPTDLSARRRPTGVVEPGTRVRILGQLDSEKGPCYRGSHIKLIEVGAGQIARDRTGAQGKYRFRVRVQETTRFRVRFAGKDLNVEHPHTHVCEASKASIRVRVG